VRQHDAMLEFDESIHTDNNPSEEKRLEARDELRNLALAIRTLPPRTKKAFTLSRLYRYSYAEIGDIMGISPRTVEGHVAKGLTACTQYMLEPDKKNGLQISDNVVQLATSRPNR